MGLYEKFLERKQNGEKLDISKITREELKTMWYDEVKVDRKIAELFDVTVSRVKMLRRRMGLLWQDIQFEERIKLIATLDGASRDIPATAESLSKKDKDQFEHFIEELNNWFKKNK